MFPLYMYIYIFLEALVFLFLSRISEFTFTRRARFRAVQDSRRSRGGGEKFPIPNEICVARGRRYTCSGVSHRSCFLRSASAVVCAGAHVAAAVRCHERERRARNYVSLRVWRSLSASGKFHRSRVDPRARENRLPRRAAPAGLAFSASRFARRTK